MKIDDIAIPVLCIAVGALRVVLQLVEGGTWGAEATIAAIMLTLGVLAVVGLLLDHHHRPRRRSPGPEGLRPRNGESS